MSLWIFQGYNTSRVPPISSPSPPSKNEKKKKKKKKKRAENEFAVAYCYIVSMASEIAFLDAILTVFNMIFKVENQIKLSFKF